jgi:hypothetical protein
MGHGAWQGERNLLNISSGLLFNDCLCGFFSLILAKLSVIP